MDFLHIIASIVTISTALYTIGIALFGKNARAGSIGILKLINILALIVIAVAILFTALVTTERQIPGIFQAHWTKEHRMMIPGSNIKGGYKYGTIRVSVPSWAKVLEVNCYYPNTDRTSKLIVDIDTQKHEVTCKGGHRKHDNKRAIHLEVCYSKFRRKCPESKNWIEHKYKN